MAAGPETCPLKAEPRRTAPDPTTGTATTTASGADVTFDVDSVAKACLDDETLGRAPPFRRARVREHRALALVRYVPIEAFAAFGYFLSEPDRPRQTARISAAV